MSRIINFQKYAGIATVVILWTSLLTAIRLADLDLMGKVPLSSLGVMQNSAVYFSLGLVLAALTLMVFGLYLKKVYVVRPDFLAALYVGQVGQIVAGLVPYGDKQPAKTIHTIAAFVLAFTLPILMWRFAAAQKSNNLRASAYKIMCLELAAFVVGIGWFAFFMKGAPIGQILPAVVFHVWILFFSFHSFHLKENQ